MPRPYSFDHFQVPKTLPQSRSMRRRDKEHLAQSRSQTEELAAREGVHYGKSFSETEENFHARQMEAQLEELARQEPDGKFSHGMSTPARAASKRASREDKVREDQNRKQASKGEPVIRGTLPIGALPPTREQPPRGRFPDLIDDAGRQLQTLRGGLGDAVKAVARLAALPFEVIRLAARRLNPLHG
ncbi:MULTISPECIES: hypothetical protein [Myxococcus]|uniref:Uncharacterized protein n=1 Tax=Myxococcus llanfairpwllgwyngyllgogerychwyrndrobwllllantysiliogogogochensis TaxID=2590453 RepID=A0A540WK93_9BACT|nr:MULTISPECIES: hypothetical protein [Myxococcus]NTX03985.1 hypothetical protein [Myxococcus sp. CA040A]TQF09440.1 hypothetical protein FJV41_44600 [Myxococcus llanfairpwllgwyngyllgogerychwyrndrobwllllantysiliogogogochensis]